MAAHTDNSILINAPVDVVWRIANDVADWPNLFIDEYADAEILETHPDRLVFRLTTVPGPDGVQRSWVSERVMDAERLTATSRRIETGPFVYMHIFQSFTQTEDGTLLRWVQDFEVRPEAPFTEEQMHQRIDGNSKIQQARHKEVIEASLSTAGTGEA